MRGRMRRSCRTGGRALVSVLLAIAAVPGAAAAAKPPKPPKVRLVGTRLRVTRLRAGTRHLLVVAKNAR